jgi:hypothetical protein
MQKLHHSRDLSALEKIAESKGFKSAPVDHSIYSEGATITFIRPANHRTSCNGAEKVDDAQNGAAAGIANAR